MANIYCVNADLDYVYGPKNIKRWADLDNDGNITTITDRKTWAIGVATEYINSRLLRGPYTIPFNDPPPVLIANLTAMYAGILLYDGRQVVSSEEPHDQVSRQRKDFERYLRQILKGQLKLIDGLTGDPLDLTCENYPFVVKGSSDDTVTKCSDCC